MTGQKNHTTKFCNGFQIIPRNIVTAAGENYSEHVKAIVNSRLEGLRKKVKEVVWMILIFFYPDNYECCTLLSHVVHSLAHASYPDNRNSSVSKILNT